MERNEARVGSTQLVLIDHKEDTTAIGRTRGQALEVDGVVTVANAAHLQSGDFVNVCITEAIEHDLVGEIA